MQSGELFAEALRVGGVPIDCVPARPVRAAAISRALDTCDLYALGVVMDY